MVPVFVLPEKLYEKAISAPGRISTVALPASKPSNVSL
jgi:hypothetical protein